MSPSRLAPLMHCIESFYFKERSPAFLRRSSEGRFEQSSSWRALHSWLPPSSSYTACSSSSSSTLYTAYSSLSHLHHHLLHRHNYGIENFVRGCSVDFNLIVGRWSLLLRFEEEIQFARVLSSRRSLDNQRFPVKSHIAHVLSGQQLKGLFPLPNILELPSVLPPLPNHVQLTWGGHEGLDLSYSTQDVVLKDVWGESPFGFAHFQDRTSLGEGSKKKT